MRLWWRLLAVVGLGLVTAAGLVGLLPRRGGMGRSGYCGSLLDPNVGCETIVARGGSWPIFWALLVLALVTLGAAAVIWLTDREQRAAS